MSDIEDENDELENSFTLAANYIQNHHNQFNKDDLLKFYGFYKQATVGKCNTSRPGMFNFQDKAKWDSWNTLGDLSKEEAQKSYINHLDTISPDWNTNKKESKQGSRGSGSFGAFVSRPKAEDPEENAGTSIEDFVKQGNLTELQTVLTRINPSQLNSLDSEGLGLLHWAADRGNSEILSFLLSTKGIDVNLKDSEGQTPLFYASSCGHVDCIQLLLKHNADKNILDNDNCSCIDVAFDDNIKQLLS